MRYLIVLYRLEYHFMPWTVTEDRINKFITFIEFSYMLTAWNIEFGTHIKDCLTYGRIYITKHSNIR